MKRSWMGAALLAGLLLLGLLSTWGMERCHAPLARALDQAGELALAERWEEAESYVNYTKEKWERNWGFAASLADHEPMERINGLYAQLEISGKERDPLVYAMLCAQLKEEMEAMGEAHSLKWWNLL